MKKKLLSLIMAVAMIASLALPAFAAATTTTITTADSNGVYTSSTTVSSQTRVAVVKVTLPLSTGAANKVILNPYELKLFTSGSTDAAATSGNKVGSADDGVAAADGATSPQVITVPMEIKSESDVPLTVGLTAKATVGGETKLSATDVDQSAVDTDKNLFLYVDMLRTTDGSAVDWTADTAPSWRDDSSKVNTDAFSQVIPTAQGAKRENIISIPEGTAGKYVYFKIMGSAAPSPKKNWTSSDTVSVELAFTFAPTKTYAVTAKKPSGATFANAAASDYVVGFGGETSATPGSSVVLKAGNNKIFSDVLIIKAPDAANGITEADEVTAATAVKVTDDTYYFVMPAEPVYIHASVETAS